MYISLLTALHRWTAASLGFWRSTPVGLWFNLPIPRYPFTAASQLLQPSYTCVCVAAQKNAAVGSQHPLALYQTIPSPRTMAIEIPQMVAEGCSSLCSYC
jgi:hypothetical protein